MSATFERSLKEIRKPANDKREYRYITLSNKLKCVLVSDPDTEKSAACVDVHVGSMSDPPNAQGLAHFLEHMLFMGTEKYPEENEYSAYLSNHGGYSNAYTSQENTVYYFDVQNDFFEGALDLFASFFTCPLFTEASTMREINAVDSEHNKNIQSDSWRKFQLFKTLSRELHPLHSFSTGNLETLGKVPESQGLNIRQMMIDFYNQYYSSNIMCLSLYGNSTLDQMEQWVAEKFAAVPNKNLTRVIFPSDPFREEQLKKIVEFVPVRDLKTLDVIFPIPSTEDLYLTKPVRYISHLLGHESDGSILSVLKSKHWANGLSAYQYQNTRDFACFTVSVELSEAGFQHVDEIIGCVFAYIGMILKSGPKDWVWDELRDIAEMDFRFLDKIDASDYAVNIANFMQLYPPELVLCGDKLQFEKDLDASFEILSMLQPSNSLIFLSHKQFQGKTTLTEQWYHTEYNLRTFDEANQIPYWDACLQHAFTEETNWMNNLHLPQPNPFIPTDFTLKHANSISPEDERFIIPKLIHQVVHRREITTDTPSAATANVSDANAVEETKDVKMEVDGADVVEGETEEDGEEVEEDGDEEEDEEDEGTPAAAAAVSSTDIPTPIYGKSAVTWHKQDHVTWCMPKVNVFVSIENHLATICAHNIVMTDLLAQMLKELMTEYSYYADCAGIYKNIALSRQGIQATFQGYGHKLPVLIQRTMEVLYHITESQDSSTTSPSSTLPQSTPQLFALVKEKMIRSYKNQFYSQPYYHCMLGSYLCLEEPRFALPEKYLVLLTIEYDAWIAYVKSYLWSCKLECLMTGNITDEESIALQTSITDLLHLPSTAMTATTTTGTATTAGGGSNNRFSYSMDSQRRGVDLFHSPFASRQPKNIEYVYYQLAKEYNPQEANSAIENLYFIGIAANQSTVVVQKGGEKKKQLAGLIVDDEEEEDKEESDDGIYLECMIQLITQIMSEPAFDQLRTKEQLGYMVFSGVRRIAQNILAIYMIIQSNHKDAHYLNHRTEAFLHYYFRPLLLSLTTNQLQDYIVAVKEKLLEKPKNLDQESNSYWEEITSNAYLFNRKALLVEKLLSLTITNDTLVQFYDRYLAPVGGKNARIKVSSQFYGKSAMLPTTFSVPKEGMTVTEGVIPLEQKVVVIQDVNLFKRQLPLLPVLACEPE